MALGGASEKNKSDRGYAPSLILKTMKRILFILCLICSCISTSAQLSDYKVHFYISKNWQGSGKATVYALYFEGNKLYQCQFFPSYFQQGYSSESDLLPDNIKIKASKKKTYQNCVLYYSSSYSNQSRTTYYQDDIEFELIVGQEAWGPRTKTFSGGEFYISVSNDKSEFIKTEIYNGKTDKNYYIEVPRSYLFDKSTRINKSFVNE